MPATDALQRNVERTESFFGGVYNIEQAVDNKDYGLAGGLAVEGFEAALLAIVTRGRGQSVDAPNNLTLNSGGDRLIGSLGSARVNNADEFSNILGDLRSSGVDVDFRSGQFAYGPAASPGRVGNIVIDPDASISAIRHEYGHFLDDKALGFPGQRAYYENPSLRVSTERRQYLQEIGTAREIGDQSARRQLIMDYLEERNYLIENYYTRPYGSR